MRSFEQMESWEQIYKMKDAIKYEYLRFCETRKTQPAEESSMSEFIFLKLAEIETALGRKP